MKVLFSILMLALFSCGFRSGDNDKNPNITAAEIQNHINYLASDELEGRFTGSKGAESAAKYIMNDFKATGLKPLFNGSFYQEYPFIAGLKLSDNNSLEIDIQGKALLPEIKEEYIPAPFSGSKTFEGNIIFAGYGISAPDLNYDDYEGIDVKNKIVLVMRYNPEEDNPHSEFEKFSPYRYKAKIAQEHGAAGIIFVNGYIPKDDEDKLMKLNYDGAGSMDSFAVIQVKREIADKLFKSENSDFKDYQKQINENKKPASFEFKNAFIKLKTEVNEITKQAKNVAGYIEGNDPKLKNEYIVIGAHYDHLGYGETGSLYRGKEPMIHNGADDNASGTAGVLELAEKFESMKSNLKEA